MTYCGINEQKYSPRFFYARLPKDFLVPVISVSRIGIEEVVAPVFFYYDGYWKVQCVRFEQWRDFHYATFITTYRDQPARVLQVTFSALEHMDKSDRVSTRLLDGYFGDNPFYTYQDTPLSREATVPVYYRCPSFLVLAGYRQDTLVAKEVFIPNVIDEQEGQEPTILRSFRIWPDGIKQMHFSFQKTKMLDLSVSATNQPYMLLYHNEPPRMLVPMDYDGPTDMEAEKTKENGNGNK